MKGHPATIDCVAEPVSHAVIECAEQIIPYKGPDEPGRLKVTRLDSDNQPDPNGKRWHLELQVRAKEVEEWFDSYVCRCEAWNKVIELQRPKKVFSKEAVVIEAYLDRKFQLEPVSTDLSYGKRLVLTCIPPKGKPEPEVYWLKDGKRVNKDNFAHIILNDYNHLIIENVTEKDAGNYTCVAECLGMEYRYAMAKVTVTALTGSHTFSGLLLSSFLNCSECPGRNILPDMLDLNSGTTAAQQLFSAHKVGSVLTEASSGKSSSNMATNTTAVGSVNADSSNGSLGIGATHSPSGLLLAQTGEAVVGDGETRQYNSNYSNGINPPWNYSCEIQESDVVISANLTENGGLICSSTSGVYLKIPQGAVHGISEESVYLAICRDERIRPILGDHQTLLSPIVQFGPVSMHPHQGVILSFPHCAALNEGPWYLRVVATGIQSTPTVPKCKEDNVIKPKTCDFTSLFQEYEQEGHDSVTRSSVLTWKEVCAIVSQNDEYKIIDSQHGMTCHIDTLEVHLLTQQPQRYCLIGETFFRPRLEQQTLELPPVWPVNIKNDRPAKKMLRLTAYSARPTPTMDYNIRVYILPDIRDILEHVKATELRLDGYVLDTTDPLPFYDTGQGMCFSIEDVSKGWRSRLHMNTQEVPFRHIWGGTQLPTLHCAFTLEHIDHTQNSVSCRIIAFQGMNWEQRKILHISSDCIDNATSPTNTVPVAIPSKQMAFFRMKDSTREMICDFMNIENNWRELAKKMKFERYATLNDPDLPDRLGIQELSLRYKDVPCLLNGSSVKEGDGSGPIFGGYQGAILPTRPYGLCNVAGSRTGNLLGYTVNFQTRGRFLHASRNGHGLHRDHSEIT
ncbi:netrin receptor unc-5 [Clonorchis sinensis]|uniref:Netrin receptor UNC5 n=1 Tax=Clonorchis sinensis TaxID=79923 RepID=G7YAD9_CLOSI|nr:netrin receptor unc-5 [Clonorchis sinensis]